MPLARTLRRFSVSGSLPTRLAAILAVPVLIYIATMTVQKALDNAALNREAESIRAEVSDLDQENRRLQREIVAAQTDAAIEAQARTELGLVMPGDNAVVLYPPTAAQATVPRRSRAPVDSRPNWKQWWDVFFGHGPS